VFTPVLWFLLLSTDILQGKKRVGEEEKRRNLDSSLVKYLLGSSINNKEQGIFGVTDTVEGRQMGVCGWQMEKKDCQ
jgi:hypothetical protein